MDVLIVGNKVFLRHIYSRRNVCCGQYVDREYEPLVMLRRLELRISGVKGRRVGQFHYSTVFLVRVIRFELAPSAWKADMLAARHQSRIKNAGHYSGVKWAGRK